MTKLKEALKNNTLTIGSWITFPHPGIAEMMARTGFDWLAIDIEHTAITYDQAEQLIRTIDLCGISPLVRLTSNDQNQIKRVMDSGAHGVIVPMVNTAEEAEKAVRSVYYPPKGNRGVGLSRAQGYGANFDGYKTWLEKSAVVIVQIEHIDGVKNFEKILAVDGVDGYIVGPYDLSGSLGLPGQFDHPKVKEALAQIKDIAAASKHKKPGGFHVVNPDTALLNSRIKEGFKFMAFSTDMRMLDVSCRENLKEIRR